MGTVIVDAFSHQAIRDLGTEGTHYNAAPDQSGKWRGRRLFGFRSDLAAAGHELVIAPPTPEHLATADVLVIASRSQSVVFTGLELEAVAAFVREGGGLLLMANHRHFILPQQQIAVALKLPLSFNDTTIGQFPEFLLAPHPSTSAVERLYVRNCTSMRAGPPAAPIAAFAQDPRQIFAVSCAAGKGRVIATGDSGFLASSDDTSLDMYASVGNAQFFTNAIAWLMGKL